MPGRPATRKQRKRHEAAADWIFRNNEPGQSAAEKAAFRNWLDSDPDNRRVYAEAQRLMSEAQIAIQSDPALRELEIKPRNLVKPVTGSLVGLAVAGALFFLFDGPMRLEADAIAGTGELPIVTLSDGSILQLNAASAVAYDYSDTKRSVRLLRGQVFFEVAPDPNRPFTVEAGDVRVTALGTAFDIRLGDTEMDVTVTHNAVMLESIDGDQEPVRVQEGQQAAINNATGLKEIKPADGLVALAWQRGQLVIDNAPLSFVVEEMSRHFAGRIVIANSELARRRVSGALTISDTNAALAFLEHALGVTTSRLGPLVVIRN